jgi:diguanylate cyclase (GGDEF)-like protein
LSLLVATFASYVGLDLAKRVRDQNKAVAFGWWAGGSVALGTGIWCMHFVGMLAFTLPIELGYSRAMTALSWGAAVAASGIALFIAGDATMDWRRLCAGSAVMGAGISAMHYTGMAAMEMAPGIEWHGGLVALSVVIAVGASMAALLVLFLLRKVSHHRSQRWQVASGLILGMAICGMHYSGMAAAQFPVGSVCLAATEIKGAGLDALLIAAAMGLLVLTLFTSSLDARMQLKAANLAASLQIANSSLIEANNELRQRALTDPLTGLANRVLFEDRLEQASNNIKRASGRTRRESTSIGVLFIDLDGFKAVNDSMGHAAGDVLLRQCASRLLGTARSRDTVARVGGDEFVLLLEEVQGITDCVAVAMRILESLAQPFEIGRQVIEISASVGIVLYPDHGSPDRLVSNADAAMYVAKRTGGNSYSIFNDEIENDGLARLSLQGDLRHAVERGQLRLHYQPKIDTRTGAVRGVEALLRWIHPELGNVSPVVFIPLAERFGSINLLGNWVIEEACRQMAEWAAAGQSVSVAINLSVHQLLSSDLTERVVGTLSKYGVSSSQLLCEITESVAMEDFTAAKRSIDGLAAHGVFLSIDDFGTGHSSLSYLKQLPASQLKIDRSFVKDLEGDADVRAIVDAVIRLSHALGLRVVAEGVETVGQQQLLAELGCDELQGYLFSAPLAAGPLIAWMEKRRIDRVPVQITDCAVRTSDLLAPSRGPDPAFTTVNYSQHL